MKTVWKKLGNIPIPHTYVLLVSFILIAAVLSYIIPAGEFTRVSLEGREVIDPASYHSVPSHPISLFEILKSFPLGFARTQHISYFLFVTGGAFALVNQTGMIEAGLSKIVKSLKGYEAVVIPLVLLIMGVAGSTIGLSEETIVFITIGVTLARGIGYDALIGVAMISLGAGFGFTAGFMNPFSVGVAQSIAGLPLFSGMALRIVLFIVLWLATSFFLVTYARKIQKNPQASLVYEEEEEAKSFHESQGTSLEAESMTLQQKLVALVFIGGFGIIAYGVSVHGWFITEIAAVFLGMGIFSALINGSKPAQIADTFIEGAKDMMYAALIVGIAQSLVVILEQGLILDPLIYGLTRLVGSLPSVFSAAGMYLIQVLINFFISSGSGQAAVTMPIMVPLADALGVTRQTAVLAFHLGNGFLDSVMPMSGILMAQLAIAKIPYKKWVKFVMPLMGIWLVIGLIFVIAAQLMVYGPF